MRMNALLVDVREAVASFPTGKGMWVKHVVSACVKKGIPLLLLTDSPVPECWHTDTVHVRQFCRSMFWHVSVWNFLRYQPVETVYISPTSYIIPACVPSHIRSIPVVHDLIAFRSEPHSRRAQWIERLLLRRCLRNAYCICTVSESTKRDLLEKCPFVQEKKVMVVGAGPTVSLRAAPPLTPRLQGEGKARILCIGTLCPRKNQLRLIEAFSQLDTDVELILVGGRGWSDSAIVRAAQETPRVRWMGYVSMKEMQELLQSSTLLAFPSLYEGFGFPVLDAFVCSVPVLTSERGSLREIAGDAALVVDPEDVSSIRHGLAVLLSDGRLRETLVQKGRERATQFSWERTVEKICESSTLSI
ncbi:hypothetical protein COU77_03240 [Candidatus Peregrinibacteria bacterium CG10_big_fil_rev_8_21_14_0_10_49_16]|nr:MAG: hypothetical protein COW95_02035 [Candidatus Peregrinibacteria bacterium CG22_combo_CG10-13_8_21_14_all_49_11]PIR51903.1 MAG: hypothetical protein COU77_03240 [Candidatus Peregrinibacteria bacterium CG10_big_fil_rev_8_21_14_0_10_49_16]